MRRAAKFPRGKLDDAARTVTLPVGSLLPVSIMRGMAQLDQGTRLAREIDRSATTGTPLDERRPDDLVIP
jgi:hypothetical protein